MTEQINRVCVFAHYDYNDIVDDYVYYYLNELLLVVQKLVFVSVSEILASTFSTTLLLSSGCIFKLG